MKNRIRLLSALLAVFVLCGLFAGCSGQSETGEEPLPQEQTGSGVRSVEDIYGDIIASVALPGMYVLEDAYIEGYYGIAADAIEEKVFAVAEDSMLADTVIILKVSETGVPAEIASRFGEINNQRLAEMESYNPEQYARAIDATIGTSGDYIYYIITDSNSAVTDIIENSIG